MIFFLKKNSPVKNSIINQYGFSLIELVISIVILSFTFVAMTSTLFPGVSKGSDTLWQSKATQLSQAYLDEILAMRYQEDSPLGGGPAATGCSISGPDSGETGAGARSLFDDVDDYNGLDETADFLDTAANSNYSGYRVSISVSCRDIANDPSTDTKLIQLTVSSPTNQSMIFSAFRADL